LDERKREIMVVAPCGRIGLIFSGCLCHVIACALYVWGVGYATVCFLLL
jgi:hypothetical protein